MAGKQKIYEESDLAALASLIVFWLLMVYVLFTEKSELSMIIPVVLIPLGMSLHVCSVVKGRHRGLSAWFWCATVVWMSVFLLICGTFTLEFIGVF